MKRRRLFSKGKKGAPQDMVLNITSMADIFTILLVFLLKSFASSASNISPSPGVVLPAASSSDANIEAARLEVSKSAILLENNIVLKLDNYQFPKTDVKKNGPSNQLSQALKKERKRQLLIAQTNKTVKVDSKIVIIADQNVPYKTIKTVLASAAVNGFTDFKLAVVQNE